MGLLRETDESVNLFVHESDKHFPEHFAAVFGILHE